MKRNNDFRYDLAIGNHFEDVLADIFNNKTIEVKTCFGTCYTDKLFIEFECSGKPSGVMTSEADYYCFIISMDYMIFVKSDMLKDVVKTILKRDGFKTGGDNNALKGVLIDVDELRSKSSKIHKEQIINKEEFYEQLHPKDN